MKAINLGFEAFDFCPLRCNSCPQGRREHTSTGRALSPALLQRALVAVYNQRPINTIGLIGWGEPLLNPKLPELVHIAKRFGYVWISTTGNYWACDLLELAQSRPHRFSVSISGMTQAVHGTTHEGGDIEKAKWFIERLYGFGMRRFSVIFHRYNNNLHEEPLAREYCRKLGLKFEPIWGRHHAVEDLIAWKGNPYLLVPIPDQLHAAKQRKQIDCPLQTNHLAIDADGNVRGCVVACERSIIGNVFRDSVKALLEKKMAYPLCDKCYAAAVNQIVCSQTVASDAFYARRTPGTPADKLRWFIERCKKRVWVARD